MHANRKRSSYGPGPRPTVPTREQVRAAAEGLIERLLRDATGDELDQLPDPENLLGLLQFARQRRREELPQDADVLDRLMIIRYLEDVLQREKLAALMDGQRARVPLLAQARALGKQSKQAAFVERNRLAAMFSEQQPCEEGVRRGTRNDSAFIAAQRKTQQMQAWSAQYQHTLEKVAGQLVDAAAHLEAGEYSRFFLEELAESLDEARSVTGEWVPVAQRLSAVVRHIDKEQSGDLSAHAEEALREARSLVEQINAALGT